MFFFNDMLLEIDEKLIERLSYRQRQSTSRVVTPNRWVIFSMVHIVYSAITGCRCPFLNRWTWKWIVSVRITQLQTFYTLKEILLKRLDLAIIVINVCVYDILILHYLSHYLIKCFVLMEMYVIIICNNIWNINYMRKTMQKLILQ